MTLTRLSICAFSAALLAPPALAEAGDMLPWIGHVPSEPVEGVAFADDHRTCSEERHPHHQSPNPGVDTVGEGGHPPEPPAVAQCPRYAASLAPDGGFAHQGLATPSRIDMRHKAYYALVRDVIAANIASGALPQGVRLLTAAVAERLSISRSPVKRALDDLEAEGLISPLPGQGYVVGPPIPPGQSPSRENLHALDLDLTGMQVANELVVQPLWEELQEPLARAILHTIPFGAFQISESAVADEFSVSRTVAHEALVRLNADGLISKRRSSHWMAGPMSARMLDEAYELRRQLEPQALVACAAGLERDALLGMRAALDAAAKQIHRISPQRIDGFEVDLHVTCLARLRNQRLHRLLMGLQFDHIINRLFRNILQVVDDSALISEHRLVLEHLLIGNAEGTASALAFHLKEDHQRTRARLKVLSIFDDPPTPAWMTRIH